MLDARKATLLAADDSRALVLYHCDRQPEEISSHQATWSMDPPKFDRVNPR